MILWLLLSELSAKLPTFTRGLYLLLADNTTYVANSQGQTVRSTQQWTPKIGAYIKQYNVVFFCFINSDMVVPPSFQSARQSGQFDPATKLVYSIGGYSYSFDTAGWKKWFGSAQSAKSLAKQVAKWKVDGIDIDIEDGAGQDQTLAANMVVFARELKAIRPDFIITQPVFGYPQVYSQSLMVVSSWNANGSNLKAADAIGIMVYSGIQSLNYLGAYTGQSCTQWWCALCNDAKVNYPCASVPKNNILAGMGGDASQADIKAVCGSATGGYMTWYGSAQNGFQYGGGSNDARVNGKDWRCLNVQNRDSI